MYVNISYREHRGPRGESTLQTKHEYRYNEDEFHLLERIGLPKAISNEEIYHFLVQQNIIPQNPDEDPVLLRYMEENSDRDEPPTILSFYHFSDTWMNVSRKLMHVSSNQWATNWFELPGIDTYSRKRFSEHFDDVADFNDYMQRYIHDLIAFVQGYRMRRINELTDMSGTMGASAIIDLSDIISEEDDRESDLTGVVASLPDSPLIQTPDGIYAMELRPVAGDSLADIEERLTESLKRRHEMRLSGIRTAHKRQVDQLKKRIDDTKTETFIATIGTLQRMLNSGWDIEENKIVYNQRIYVNQIKNDGNIYEIVDSGNNRRRFYVEGLMIPIQPRPDRVYAKKAYHPNVGDERNVCMGSLSGKKLDKILVEVVDMLKMANLDNPFGVPATEYMERDFDELTEGGSSSVEVFHA